jgi:NitT/TauT family transport system ATP-binding protein
VDAAVKLAGVSVEYALPGGERYSAVQPVDLTVGDGEFVALLGPTGCGKSTLLNIAAGLMPPSSGFCAIFGERIAGLNAQAGYLFQQDALMPWKTALNNVAIGLEVMGVARSEALSRARAMLAEVGLASFEDRYPHQLSGGQRKRVALAQILIRKPKILLMDEPFGPLDAQTRLIMSELLLELWQQDRKAVMFVTHDLDEAIALSDRVVVMSAGPESRFIGDFQVNLPRPRDIAEVRSEPAFHKLHADIWSCLREEVRKTYGPRGRGTA